MVLQNQWEGKCLLKFAISPTSTITSILALEKKMILIISNNCVPFPTLNVEGSFWRSQKFRTDLNAAIQSFLISILIFILINNDHFKQIQGPRYRIPRLKSTYFISGGCLLPRLF